MKLKWFDWIPGYGYKTYFKRYFSGEKRNLKDALQAEWMALYQIFTILIVILSILKVLGFTI